MAKVKLWLSDSGDAALSLPLVLQFVLGLALPSHASMKAKASATVAISSGSSNTSVIFIGRG
ncbi:hypothetical protein GN958_ATG16073 [Phytophthora infestans]|uniref:Uncharacterized protein n=1 Tax=Phytophthora infestans TaxID=4787 RepID=A0A8S9U5W5_PHYIN|nr:hypothetical protein GN958_ATG16073 [Phytophthora infestans]